MFRQGLDASEGCMIFGTSWRAAALSGTPAWLVLLALLFGCAPAPDEHEIVLTFPGSAVGKEAELLARQLERFTKLHPGVRVVQELTPDTADERHQLYVQWLNGRAGDPDLLQLDVVWTPEFAAAGWLLPLDGLAPDTPAFFEATVSAQRFQDRLYALPWFVDVGMLYFRSDLVQKPETLEELAERARKARADHRLAYGFVWQGARYEGLVTVFVELLGAFGGGIVDEKGLVVVDSPQAVRALVFLRATLGDTSPRAVLGWREEQTRFAFQNGQAAFMRNWPYAWALLADETESRVAGRFEVASMPGTAEGAPSATLGGAALAINARTEHPEQAFELVRFLTSPEQMLERARELGQLPSRHELYRDRRLSDALGRPAEPLRRIVEHALPRPVTPVYAELSQVLQIRLHRALTDQEAPQAALEGAAQEMRSVLADAGLSGEARELGPSSASRWTARGLFLSLLAAAAISLARAARGRARGLGFSGEARLAWSLMAPALAVVAAFALFPLGYAAYESIHAHDLRMPWRGQPFVGLENYATLLEQPRFWAALGRTLAFTAVSVGLELVLGLCVALLLDRSFRGRGVARTIALLPWAVPTVVGALVFRLLFEDRATPLSALGPPSFFSDPLWAWLPLILADLWKTTPFVTLLLLAGLQTIDPVFDEAARVDGAGWFDRLLHVTLPQLRPALLVAVVFRSLDAFRVFDLVYVLTGGGPGTATEPIALLTYSTLFGSLRFGLGSALSVVVFLVSFGLALVYVRLLGQQVRAS